MNTKLFTIFTRTPLHIGAGSSVGVVDLPVVRERHTGYPVIPGSALKGVLADLWLKADGNVQGGNTPQGTPDTSISEASSAEGNGKDRSSARNEDALKLFGNDPADKTAQSGSLLIGEGKLLAFPVRSAKGCWAWITCPLALRRFARDYNIAYKITKDKDSSTPELQPKKNEVSLFVSEPRNEEVYAPDKLKVDGSVVFEEYPLKIEGTVSKETIEVLAGLSDDEVWKTLGDHLAIVSDELFAYFVQNACEIANHNRIDDKTGVVANGALFSQENVPSETMFYSVLNTQKSEDFEKLDVMLGLKEKPADWTSDNQKIYDYPVNKLLQIGADMTTGLGWCSVATKEVK